MSFHCLKILDKFHFHFLNGSSCTTTSVDASNCCGDDVADDDANGGGDDYGVDDGLLQMKWVWMHGALMQSVNVQYQHHLGD